MSKSYEDYNTLKNKLRRTIRFSLGEEWHLIQLSTYNLMYYSKYYGSTSLFYVYSLH